MLSYVVFILLAVPALAMAIFGSYEHINAVTLDGRPAGGRVWHFYPVVWLVALGVPGVIAGLIRGRQ